MPDILDNIDNAGFTEGIYNYCDRWCEKCMHTSKCLSFSLEEKQDIKRDLLDSENTEFWKDIEGVFKQTLDMLYEIAEAEGVDLDEIPDEVFADEELKRKEIRKEAEETVYCKLAKNYSVLSEKWFDNSGDIFDKKDEEFDLKKKLQTPKSDPDSESEIIQELIEIIIYYQHFIYTKLSRALKSKIEFTKEPEDTWLNDDANGSAKVALIALERSTGAWVKFLKIFKETEGEIFKILITLEKIKKGVEKDFPDAQNFIRPGLDE